MFQIISTITKKHSLATFIFLAYAFSWWMWPFYVWGLLPAVIVGFGPFLAAVVVLGLTEGRAAVSNLFRQMTHWRVSLRWYGLALGLPILISGLAAAINILLGAPVPKNVQLAQWTSLLPAFLLLLLVPGIGGAWEEPGWRGYLLPRLQHGHSRLSVIFPMALVIAGWHLPLFLTGLIPWADLLYLFGTIVIFNWVYYRTGKSVLIVMVFHAMNNAVGQFFPSLFSDAYVLRLALLQGVICVLVALVLLITRWQFWTGRSAAPQGKTPVLNQ